MKASLGRGNSLLLAIVFSVGSAFPLAGQPPAGQTTQRTFFLRPVPQSPVPQFPRPTKPPVSPTARPTKAPAIKTPFPATPRASAEPTPQVNSNAWNGIIIILGALGVSVIVWVWPRSPKVKLVPFKDYGEQSITSAGPLLLALKLCPVLDPGNQELEKIGALVATRGG